MKQYLKRVHNSKVVGRLLRRSRALFTPGNRYYRLSSDGWAFEAGPETSNIVLLIASGPNSSMIGRL